MPLLLQPARFCLLLLAVPVPALWLQRWQQGSILILRGGDVAREDLIPLNKRTKDEQKKIAAEGGRASGVARRRKRSLKEAADLFLSLPVSDRRRWNKLARKGIEPDDVDNQMEMIVGLQEAAALGDAKAAKVLIDLIGEDAKDDTDGGVTIVDDIP